MAEKAGKRGIEPLAERACFLEEAGVELGPRPSGDPRRVDCRVDGQAEPDDGTRVAAQCGWRGVTRDLGHLEGADDAARIADVDRASERTGASARRRSASGSRPSPSGPPRVRHGWPGRSGARRCPGRARRHEDRARSRRPGSRPRPARRSRSSASRAWATKSATLNGWSGSTRSRPWCGTRARSVAFTLAVPMSRPRKTWRESAR